MSMIIKGKQPTNVTFEAWFYQSGIVAFYDSNGKRLGESKWEELPPHGRLGDLDSLKEIFADELNRYKQIPLDNDDKQETALLHLESAMRIITNAPTIIEADKEEKSEEESRQTGA